MQAFGEIEVLGGCRDAQFAVEEIGHFAEGAAADFIRVELAALDHETVWLAGIDLEFKILTGRGEGLGIAVNIGDGAGFVRRAMNDKHGRGQIGG